MIQGVKSTQPVPRELWLPRHLCGQVEEWAAASYPHEACGLLIGHSEGPRSEVARVTAARNLNRHRPRDRYLLDPADFLAADCSARDDGLDVVGFWHSHPDHPARPSDTDLEAAWAGYSYLIITTTATGASRLRSWRLDGGGFREETVCQEEIEA